MATLGLLLAMSLYSIYTEPRVSVCVCPAPSHVLHGTEQQADLGKLGNTARPIKHRETGILSLGL